MLKKVLGVILMVCLIAAILPSQAETLDLINGKKTETGYRMEPLLDKYYKLTDADIQAQSSKYSDIEGHFGKAFISKLAALNIIAGYGNGKFGPNDTLLAAQYIKMMVMALGFKPEIPAGQPYWIPFVDIALKEGLVKMGEITDYTQPLSRELAGAMGYRALMKFEPQPSQDEIWYDYNVSKISDYAHISDPYKNEVVMAYRMGLIQGSNNLYVPKGTLTRAQAAVIINKLIDKNIRIESVPQPEDLIHFTSHDFNEYYFPGAYANKEYTFVPGDFPLNEIFNVVKTLVEKKQLAGGYIVNGFHEPTKFFTAELFYNKETADKYYFVNPAIPTAIATFFIHSQKTSTQPGKRDALNDSNTGYLYSINTQLVEDYNTMMKPYIHEVLKTLFGKDANEAIRLHDYHLGLALDRKDGEHKSVFLNNRKIHISGGVGGMGGTGFRMEIWAQGAIKK